MTARTTIVELSDGNSAGTRLGQDATDLISFYGAAPVAQRSNIAAVATSTVTTAATTTTPWGFATSTQADNLAALVADTRTKMNSILTNMNTLGLHAAS